MPSERINVEREIVVPEEPAKVWESLTDSDRLEEWFAQEVDLDARPGGEGVFRWGDGDCRQAVVRELDVSVWVCLLWLWGGSVWFWLVCVVCVLGGAGGGWYVRAVTWGVVGVCASAPCAAGR